ncbi:MAG: hypothetical protein K2G84_04720 [Muribaculaceae bacterium]|nr:hypothetical protein [Muribaculaceae bacterium]
MKKFYIALAALCPMLLQAAPVSPGKLAGSKEAVAVTALGNVQRGPAKVTVDEIFACPENTVLDGPYIADEVGYSGFQSSDQGRPGMSTIFYQAFHGCYKSVNEIRVIGLFNYWDEDSYNWLGCDSRGGINENYEMTEPVKFEIAFYRQDDNGRPGELVSRQESDIVGRYLGVTYGSGAEEMPLYEFRVTLNQEMKLESGFMSFSAVNMGDTPSCWFSVFTADTSMDYAYVYMGEEYGLNFANLPAVFSFMGDGSMAAQRALRVDNISAPTANANGTHEKVTVKVVNAGAQTLDDATLELWVDGQRAAVETIPVSIAPGASFNYTFMSRVDLSAVGDHKVEVRNVTPGDEGISKMKAVTSTYSIAEGEACESGHEYADSRVGITRVTVGSIDNRSEQASYTDFSTTDGGVTELRPGQTLTLSIEPMESYVTGVWIDWNNDGVFTGAGEEVGYVYDQPLEISIPEGVSVSEGLKRMRLVMDVYGSPSPCGSYYFGETEDYGIMVKRNDNTPSVVTDLKEVAEETDGDIRQSALAISNNGDAQLNASLGVNYMLSEIYEPRSLAPAREFSAPIKSKKVDVEERAQSGAAAEYVLRYDGGYESAVSLGNYSSGIFAHYYPREKMAALKGMKISSIEVYISELPEGTKIKVYGQGEDRAHAGDILAEQEFIAEAGCWNVVTLDTPVEITGEDIWFGVEMLNMSASKYHIGIDGVPALAGYGDLCNIGGNTWWSMAELGIDHNYCIRANVTGERSAYINWLTLDKETLSLGNGESANVKVTMNPANLVSGMYEAAIEIRSNDELKPSYTIPVYFANGILSSIDAVSVTKAEIRMTAEGIAITAENAISAIRVVDMSGRLVMEMTPGESSAVVPVEALADGVYILSLSYVDATSESMKFAISR